MAARRSAARKLQAMVESGGRLVLALPPVQSRRDLEESSKIAEEDGEKCGPPVEDWITLEKWGVRVSLEPLRARAGRFPELRVERREDGPLPGDLPWHGAAVFESLDPSWRTVYARDDHPVVLERSLGAGSVVVASDSFLFSNEALSRDRHADFLAWVLCGRRRLVFDESHLGVTEEPGIAALIRRFGLEGVVAVLLSLAALFIWRGASSFPPRRQAGEDPESAPVAGRDSASGLKNLLRRGIPKVKLLSECIVEWERSLEGTKAVSPERLLRAKEVMAGHEAEPARARDPVKTYQEILRILDRGEPWRKGRRGAGS